MHIRQVIVSFLLAITLPAILAVSCASCAAHTAFPTALPENGDAVEHAFKIACAALQAPNYDPCEWPLTIVQSSPNIATVRLSSSDIVPPMIFAGREELESIGKRFGFWAIVYVMAHEIGHGHDARIGVLWLFDSHQAELSADEWGGCAIARAGGKLEEATNAAIALFSESDTHPGWLDRTAALQRGADRCSS